ncbi:TetR/AcrR family transcriptional regulator [Agromyces cerinus]|uniref:Transcriptional regulator, TetR family n=1 Tax=Agromyces cerinus subsp. cerinus TaxID=232089 RepID=A0A1N6ETB2_9MICO|nr:TetR/AcrR family transcriptional regulator [Agromyces cerinus]SIN86332.1 transcriptional regulator, TetR family [Agromyces cerinus subsp. cerinus]
MEDRQAVLLDRPVWDEAETRMLDAAVELIAARGVGGVTVAEVARNAGVSRPTVYRRWASADEIVRAALLRATVSLIEQFPEPARSRSDLVRDVMRFSELFRTDPLYGRLLEREPEVFTRYTLQRIGQSQRVILQWLSTAIELAQQGGSVRAGAPGDLAVMLLLIAQSAILSHNTVSALIDEPHWSSELWHALDGHLRP